MRLVQVPIVDGTVWIDSRSAEIRVTLRPEDAANLPIAIQLDPAQSRQLVRDLTGSIQITSEVYEELARWAEDT